MAKQTFEAQFDELRAKARKMGRWIGIRFLKNRGLTLEQTMVVMFGALPRKAA